MNSLETVRRTRITSRSSLLSLISPYRSSSLALVTKKRMVLMAVFMTSNLNGFSLLSSWLRLLKRVQSCDMVFFRAQFVKLELLSHIKRIYWMTALTFLRLRRSSLISTSRVKLK